jgi:uncharacterized membrane-anchored protein YitT (DUF2179 family)
MKIKMSSYFLMGILALTLFLGVYALKTYPSKRMTALPLFACGLVFVLAAIDLRKELIKGANEKKANEQAKDAAVQGSNEVRIYLRSLSWMTGLIAAIYLVGFIIAIPLFMFGYLKLEARQGWLMSITFPAISILLIYALFVVAFKVDLFPGIVLGR